MLVRFSLSYIFGSSLKETQTPFLENKLVVFMFSTFILDVFFIIVYYPFTHLTDSFIKSFLSVVLVLIALMSLICLLIGGLENFLVNFIFGIIWFSSSVN